jgi:hypothetical protein
MQFLERYHGARGAVASSATGPVASSATGPVASSAKPSATSGRRKKTSVMSPAMSLATTKSPAPLKRQRTRTPSLAMLSAMPPAMLSAMPSASSGRISKKSRTPSRVNPYETSIKRTSRSSTRGIPSWVLESEKKSGDMND